MRRRFQAQILNFSIPLPGENLKSVIFLCIFSFSLLAQDTRNLCFSALANAGADSPDTLQVIRDSYQLIFDQFPQAGGSDLLRAMVANKTPFSLPPEFHQTSDTLRNTLEEFQSLIAEKKMDNEHTTAIILEDLGKRLAHTGSQEVRQSESDYKVSRAINLKWNHTPNVKFLPVREHDSAFAKDRDSRLFIINGINPPTRVTIKIDKAIQKELKLEKDIQEPHEFTLTPDGKTVLLRYEKSGQWFSAPVEFEKGSVKSELHLSPFLSDAGDNYTHIRFSPDGSHFIFETGDTFQIYEMGFPPRARHALLPDFQEPQKIVFSPDSKSVTVFTLSEYRRFNLDGKALGKAPGKITKEPMKQFRTHTGIAHPTKPIMVFNDSFTDVFRGALRTINTKTGIVDTPPVKQPSAPMLSFGLRHFALSPDGRYYYAVYEPGFGHSTKKVGRTQLVVYDSKEKTSIVHELKYDEIGGISVSADGEVVYLSYSDKKLLGILPTELLRDPEGFK